MDQADRDRKRRTYRVTFPTELNADQVLAWIRAISGTLSYGNSRVNGAPTIAFEMRATSQGITHRMMVAWQHSDYVVNQLRYLVPGIRVVEETEFPEPIEWTYGVELGLTHSSRTLRIPSADNLATTILSSVQQLNDTEQIVMQWVCTPAAPRHAPQTNQTVRSHHLNHKTVILGNDATKDEIKDRRVKLEEPNVMAVARLGAMANTKIRAEHLIHDVRKALASSRSASTRFHKRVVSSKTLNKRIDGARGSLVFPMQLSATELSALIAWPIGNPFVPGLPPSHARHLPPSDMVPRDGRVIGRSNMPGSERLVGIGFDQARMHCHVLGSTGVGKTTLLGNMMRQDMEAGYGVILIENKGDLFRTALDYVPHNRIQDTIVMDVTDITAPVGFNILSQGNPRVVVDELALLFEYMYRDTSSVWAREALYYGLHTLAEAPGATFIDLATLLLPRTKDEVDWADDVRRKVDDVDARRFWQRLENQPKPAQDRFFQPVLDRIWQLNGRPEIRHIIGQSVSSFQMADVIKDNKILLVNLQNIARSTASLTGTLLMNSIWHAVKTSLVDKPNFLYMDEFQDFVNMPVDPEEMLVKARSFGLGMTLSHQNLGQLPTQLKHAIMSNARSKVIFQTGSADAREMAREMGMGVNETDLLHLGAYEAMAKVSTASGVSPPFSMSTLPAATGTGHMAQVLAESKRNYGRPLADVRRDMDERYTQPQLPRRYRPIIGGVPNDN